VTVDWSVLPCACVLKVELECGEAGAKLTACEAQQRQQHCTDGIPQIEPKSTNQRIPS